MGQRVVHFEITAEDPQRAAEFYKKTFDWEFASWGGQVPYLLAATGDGPGIDGAVMPRSELLSQAVVNTIEVENFDIAAEAVRANGGKLLQDKHAVPGIGWFSYCHDTEGNTFGIMEPDGSAA